MKNLFKKNQIIITALAIMLAVAGYLNYLGDEENPLDTAANAGVAEEMMEVGDISQEDMSSEEIAANNEAILNEMLEQSTDENGEIPSQDSDVTEETSIPGTTESTTQSTTEDKPTVGEATLVNGTRGIDLISEAKMNREQLRSKNKEMLLEIIDNSKLSDSQKKEAVASMIEMTELAEKELEAETLLQAKGFTDAVVSISEGSVDVVINEEALSDAQRAQIEDIVKRKTGVEVKNIVITPIAK